MLLFQRAAGLRTWVLDTGTCEIEDSGQWEMVSSPLATYLVYAILIGLILLYIWMGGQHSVAVKRPPR